MNGVRSLLGHTILYHIYVCNYFIIW